MTRSEPIQFCVNCGNHACEPHETSWNCPGDCPTGCDISGSDVSYPCSMIETWFCACIEDPCRPVCDTLVIPPEWTDPCTGDYFGYCSPSSRPACLMIGTDAEGWYVVSSGGTAVLVAEDLCAPRWDCEVIW